MPPCTTVCMEAVACTLRTYTHQINRMHLLESLASRCFFVWSFRQIGGCNCKRTNRVEVCTVWVSHCFVLRASVHCALGSSSVAYQQHLFLPINCIIHTSIGYIAVRQAYCATSTYIFHSFIESQIVRASLNCFWYTAFVKLYDRYITVLVRCTHNVDYLRIQQTTIATMHSHKTKITPTTPVIQCKNLVSSSAYIQMAYSHVPQPFSLNEMPFNFPCGRCREH